MIKRCIGEKNLNLGYYAIPRDLEFPSYALRRHKTELSQIVTS